MVFMANCPINGGFLVAGIYLSHALTQKVHITYASSTRTELSSDIMEKRVCGLVVALQLSENVGVT